MEQCKCCKTWLFKDDKKKELPEDSGIYFCMRCAEVESEDECDCLYGCDYCLAVEPRVGRD